MKTTNKMQWLIDKYNNGTIEYLIQNTKENKGTIVAPTGYGKSGVMSADCIWHINNVKDGEKFVFHFATPRLKLGVQFMDDLISVITEIFKEKCDKGEFMFFINSSDDGRNYKLDGLNADTNRFEYDIEKFEKSATAKYALVISCFDSIYKFANKMDDLKSFAKVATYIDEAHVFCHTDRDDKEYEKLNIKGKDRYNTLEKLCKGNYIYAVTATPDMYVTEVINVSAGKLKNPKKDYIININPRELIEQNVIIPVKAHTCEVDSYCETDKNRANAITYKHCVKFMDVVKKDNPNIYHKILVSASNTEHLRELQNDISKLGYKVFSTCSRDGAISNEDDEMVGIDEVKFINEVDTYEGDCFVIHIKQLTEGIDIKSLTDIIMYNTSRVNDGIKRKIIQTVGRGVRPAAGERGVPEENRTKKHCNALFLIAEKDYEAVSRQMGNFIVEYYGIKGASAFTFDPGKDGGYGNMGKYKAIIESLIGDSFNNMDFIDCGYSISDIEIKELIMRIGEYIESVIKPRYDMALRAMGLKSSKKLIPVALKDIKDKFALYNGEYNTSTLISDDKFMKAIMELFDMYEIK
jgi:hypothetical protein